MVESLKLHCVLLRVSSGLSELLEKAACVLPVDVCFRFVDTYRYMHSAIERVNLELVFPTQKHQPHSTKVPQHKLLNRSQAVALWHIMSAFSGPPLLLLGPFGTGKTQTIVEGIQELCILQARSRTSNFHILVCTHSNSAADHYINDYLHPFIVSRKERNVADCRPLRICWEHRFTSTLSDTVLQYCLINQKTGKFAKPTREDVERHRVIVTTLVTADVLAHLDLPQGFFTHIFIDEAAQGMEVETIIPLCLANSDTKIVMAGDHCQVWEFIPWELIEGAHRACTPL